MTERLTKRQAGIIGLFTGITVETTGMNAIQDLADELLGRPTFTHEFANAAFCDALKEKARPLLAEIAYSGE